MVQDFQNKSKEIIRSSSSIDIKIKEFTDLISKFLDNSVVSVLLFDREVDEFFLRGSTIRYQGGVDAVRFSASGTVDALSLVEKRVVSMREVNRPADSRLKAEYHAFGLNTMGEMLGVVSVQSVSERGLPPEKIAAAGEAINQLADVVSIAIKEETVSERMTKIAAINEAGVNIISTLDLDRLLKLVATSASLIMEAESCVLRLYDEDSGKYTIREFYGLKGEDVQKMLFQLDRAVVVEVLKSGNPILLRDIGEDEQHKKFDGYAKTLICYPLKEGVDVIGTATIFDKFTQKTFYPIPFTSEDLNNFEKFTRYAEKAISNAITFERNEKLKNIDDVTGLPNLKYFQSRLLTELNRAKRFSSKLVLMICEIVPHVSFEEFYMKWKGDRIIKRLAGKIRGTLREYDVVARISESKFGIILPQAEDGKISAIPRIKKSIEDEIAVIKEEGKDIKVDIKFGHATYPDDGEEYEKLIFKTNILKL
ncbi:MAG: diguanylate cyclase [Deltaproteobacteria bacterium]|nr:diguanylate cyclase [Deltaproteobacteria bacterium]NIS76420.1 diguanylate cyclase [Deltaproteobacteria bacterium]